MSQKKKTPQKRNYTVHGEFAWALGLFIIYEKDNGIFIGLPLCLLSFEWNSAD